MVFCNLELTFTTDGPRAYSVTCRLDGPDAQTTGPREEGAFCIPSDWLDPGAHLRADLFRGGHSRNIVCDAPEAARGIDEKEMGLALYRQLFSPTVAGLLARAGKRRVRLVLVVGQGHTARQADRLSLIHALPWELLHDGDGFLALKHHISIVRMVCGRGASARARRRSLKVLVVGAVPESQGFAPLNLEKECRILQRHARRRRLAFRYLRNAGTTAVAEALTAGFDVVHFMGHGVRTDADAAVVLAAPSGRAQALSAEGLVRILVEALPEEKRPMLVVLNLCMSSSVFQAYERVHGMAADLIGSGVPAVLAMRRTILDAAALECTQGFYEALARRQTLDEAVQQARTRMVNSHEAAADWSVPVLFSHLRDGRVFAPKAGRTGRWLSLVALVCLMCYPVLLRRIQVVSAEETVLTQTEHAQLTTMLEARGLMVVDGWAPRRISLSRHGETLTGRLRRLLPVFPLARSTFSVACPARAGDRDTLVQQTAWQILLAMGKRTDDLAHVAAGLDMAALGDMVGAEDRFRKALAANAACAPAHHNLGVVAWGQARLSEALTCAKEAVRLAPGVAAYRYQLGRVLTDAGRWEEAQAHFQEAAELGGSAEALHALGKGWLVSRPAQAEWALRACLKQKPHHASAQRDLGRLMTDALRYGEAEAFFQGALADTRVEETYLRTDILYLQAGLYARMADAAKFCAAATAFFAEGEAAFHNGYREVAGQYLGLGCGPRVPVSEVRIRALCRGIQGRVHQVRDGRRLPLRVGSSLQEGGQLVLEPDAGLVLVGADDRVVTVQGPTQKEVADALFEDAEEIPGFYAASQQPALTEDTGLSRILTPGSKGGAEGTTVLSPRGPVGSVTDVVWLAAADGDGFILTLGRRFQGARRVVVPLDHPGLEQTDLGFARLYRLPWPWPALGETRAAWELRISDRSGRGPAARAGFQVVDAATSSVSGARRAVDTDPTSGSVGRDRPGSGSLVACARNLAVRRGATDVLLFARELARAGLAEQALRAYAAVLHLPGAGDLRAGVLAETAMVHGLLGQTREARERRAALRIDAVLFGQAESVGAETP